MLFPALLLLLGLLMFGGQAAMLQLSLEDAARAAARQAARGEPPERVSDVARQLAGQQSEVLVQASGGLVTITVSRQPSGPFGNLFAGKFSAKTVAKIEDDPWGGDDDVPDS